MDNHVYRGTSESRCASCGEFWEHPNHKAQHKQVTVPTVDLYIGIDPGVLNCALVAWSPTRGLVGQWKPAVKTLPKGVLRLRYLMDNIDRELRRLGGGHIRQIALEHYSMLEKFGQHNSGEVGGAIKLAILGFFGGSDRRAFPVLASPQQIKKFATGNGNTKKELLTKEVLKRWDMDFNDTNLAEAYILARMAHAYEAEPEMTAFQRDVIKALQGRTEWSPPPAASPAPRRLIRRAQ
jgi:crossover junction endodeoxyribonuclease RuvC